MTFGLFNGLVYGDFFVDGKELLSNPWGIMSMIDLYVGFILFSMWIFYREKNKTRAVAWIILMMVLGFFTACIYTLVALYNSENKWENFFLGSTF